MIYIYLNWSRVLIKWDGQVCKMFLPKRLGWGGGTYTRLPFILFVIRYYN